MCYWIPGSTHSRNTIFFSPIDPSISKEVRAARRKRKLLTEEIIRQTQTEPGEEHSMPTLQEQEKALKTEDLQCQVGDI